MTRSNIQLHKARHEAKNIIHAFHKAQDKLEEVQVCYYWLFPMFNNLLIYRDRIGV